MIIGVRKDNNGNIDYCISCFIGWAFLGALIGFCAFV